MPAMIIMHGHDAGVLVVLVLLLVLLVVVLLNLVNLARPIYQILARTVFLFTKKSRILELLALDE